MHLYYLMISVALINLLRNYTPHYSMRHSFEYRKTKNSLITSIFAPSVTSPYSLYISHTELNNPPQKSRCMCFPSIYISTSHLLVAYTSFEAWDLFCEKCSYLFIIMSYLKPNEMKPDLKSQTFAYYLPKKYQIHVTGRAGYTPKSCILPH